MDGLGALIISPTRELALQIFDELRKVGKHHDLSAGLLIGGKTVKQEKLHINGASARCRLCRSCTFKFPSGAVLCISADLCRRGDKTVICHELHTNGTHVLRDWHGPLLRPGHGALSSAALLSHQSRWQIA